MTDNNELKAKAKAATQGEWQVIESELPCRIGRPHVERRIFTAKDHPQLKAPYPVVNGSIALGTDETPVHQMVSMTAEDAAYIAAANPSAVLALIAENDQLKKDRRTEHQSLRSDKARNSLYMMIATSIIDDHPYERTGSDWDYEHPIHDKIISFLAERDQLRAEVAGLKTGYEAYERVNAELKAEVEGLRKALTSSREFLVRYAKVRRMTDGARHISPMFPLRKLVMEQIDAALGQGEQS